MLTKAFGLGAMRYAPDGDGDAAGGAAGHSADSGGTSVPSSGVAPPTVGSGAGGPPPVPAPDWREAIPPEYQAEKVWEPYKGKELGDVLKAHAEQSKLIGRAITLPGKDAKPEDVAKWKETQLPKLVAAGLVSAPPTAPGAYDLKQPDIPHIPPFNDQRLEFYKGGFHKLGLTQAQAQGLLELHAQDLDTLVKNADTSNLAVVQGLREEWGELQFDRNLMAAERGVGAAARRIGLDVKQARDYMDRTKKGNDPTLIQLFAGLGLAIDEDTGIGIEVAGITGPEGAQAEIERIRASDAFKTETHPGNAAALKRLEDLYKLRESAQAARR